MSDQGVDVLVIEDDPDIRATLRDVLEDAAYTVYEAPDGMSGLSRLRTHPTSLVVLLDWHMPGMDGLQVLRALAEDAPVARRHAFILLTAHYDATELSADVFPPDLSIAILAKPSGLSTILRAVNDAARQVA